ncbi:hypothetical protein [Megasphaera stantonii]|uniref:hypothetical protein n=1 Tax=Megasphaera stantonii TaxID=2144175 RepID=UPI001300384F|nr:hypothetical protein [Megasphaera stantonii]
MTMVITTASYGTKPLPLVLLFRYIHNPTALTATERAQNPVFWRLYHMLDMVIADTIMEIMAASRRTKPLFFLCRDKY